MRKLKDQRCYFLPRSKWLIFLPVFCILSCLVEAEDFLDKPTTNILPYIEAEGQPWSASKIVWVSPDKVAFTKREISGDSFMLKLKELTPEGKTEHYDKVFSVVVFDTETRRTMLHHPGILMDYQDGVMTIRQKQVYGSRSSSFPEYEHQLKGQFGQEQPMTLNWDAKPLPSLFEKCPTDDRPLSVVKRKHVFLKPEHGCLEGPFSFYSAEDGEWTFFSHDGKRSQLNIPRRDGIGRVIWIDWIGAYLLGDSVVKEVMDSGNPNSNVNTPNLRLLKPDARLLVVPINEWSVTKARPTRAGIVANWGPLGDQGLYIWRNHGIQRVAEGGGGNSIEVSPDGCKVAYFTDHKPDLFDRKVYVNHLRVIDVCKGLGVAPDANPFVWE